MEKQSLQDSLKQVYAILKFTEEEANRALKDLASIQEIEVATELVKSFSPEEVKTINGLAAAAEEEKKAVMEKIAQAHAAEEDFRARAAAAAKKVLYEHIIYLKTRGDESQKAEIAKILAELI